MVKYNKKEKKWEVYYDNKLKFSYNENLYGPLAKELAENSDKTGIRYKNFILEGSNSTSIMKIYNKKHNKIFDIIIDTEDIEKVQLIKWNIDGIGTRHPAVRNTHKQLYLHRYILDAGDVKPDQSNVVDHIDRNTFNNSKSNLRIVNNSLNQRNKSIQKNNTSGITGVRYDKTINAWTCQYNELNGKQRTKSFSVNKYGYEEAKQLAISTRKQKMKENGYIY